MFIKIQHNPAKCGICGEKHHALETVTFNRKLCPDFDSLIRLIGPQCLRCLVDRALENLVESLRKEK